MSHDDSWVVPVALRELLKRFVQEIGRHVPCLQGFLALPVWERDFGQQHFEVMSTD